MPDDSRYPKGYDTSAQNHLTVSTDDMDLPRCIRCGSKTANTVLSDEGVTVPICTGCE